MVMCKVLRRERPSGCGQPDATHGLLFGPYRRFKINNASATIAAMIHVVALRLPSHALIEYVSC
jgi:hypothetical protein